MVRTTVILTALMAGCTSDDATKASHRAEEVAPPTATEGTEPDDERFPAATNTVESCATINEVDDRTIPPTHGKRWETYNIDDQILDSHLDRNIDDLIDGDSIHWYRYDESGRLWVMFEATGQNLQRRSIETFVYDAEGRVERTDHDENGDGVTDSVTRNTFSDAPPQTVGEYDEHDDGTVDTLQRSIWKTAAT